MKHKIKYSKDLLWLKPFVDSLGLDFSEIKAIKSYKVKSGLQERQYGSVIRQNGEFTINLLAYKWNKKAKRYNGETISILLDTLAHELSHVKQKKKDFGKHDYKHFKKQSLFLYKFSAILRTVGILDTSEAFNNLV